jgi:phosphatidylserine synthase
MNGSFICKGNRSTWRKPPIFRNSPTNFITLCCIGLDLTTLVVIGIVCICSCESYHTITVPRLKCFHNRVMAGVLAVRNSPTNFITLCCIGFDLTTLVMISIVCICSCESYHTITAPRLKCFHNRVMAGVLTACNGGRSLGQIKDYEIVMFFFLLLR